MPKNVEFPAKIYSQKNDRNIYELFATPAIIQMAMIFYQTSGDVCDRKLTGILNNVEPVLYYSIVCEIFIMKFLEAMKSGTISHLPDHLV